MPETRILKDEEATKALGAELLEAAQAGDIFLLVGELGAGKTTMVRGALESLNFDGLVRSPSFNLMQVFPTDPPILHVDLYRLQSAQDLGLDEWFPTHISFIEWPDRAPELFADPRRWIVKLDWRFDGREALIVRPGELPDETAS